MFTTTNKQTNTFLNFTVPVSVLIIAVGSLVGLKAQERSVRSQPKWEAPPPEVGDVARASSRTVLSTGDRLKISFFETIDVGGPGQTGQAAIATEGLLRTFYQRMDMGGEHTIDQDGVISMPRLGTFEVAGKSTHMLREDLAAAFVRSTGRAAEVSVAIVERAPIYVVGPVKTSGAFKYAPDMIVLQAIALAGGVDREVGSTVEIIEGAREMERVERLTDKLKRMLARRARLEAEREGLSTVHAPAQLIALTGNDAANTMLVAEQTLLGLEQIKRKQHQDEAATAFVAVRKEVDALRGKLHQLDTQRQIRGEHLKDVQRLKSSGLTTGIGFMNTRSQLADVEARRHDLNAALAQAEARLTLAERSRMRLASEHATHLVNAIASVEAEIADTRLSLASATQLARLLERKSARGGHTANATRPVYQIVRRMQGNSIVLAAKETTQLQPGDVLKISLETIATREMLTPIIYHLPPLRGESETTSQPISLQDSFALSGQQLLNEKPR